MGSIKESNQLINKKMKRTLSILGLLLVMATSMSFAQKDTKFGHINSQELMAMMPEADSAQSALEAYAAQLENTLDEMRVEYNTLLQEYLAQQEQLTDLIRQAKESELQSLQQRIQEFNQGAQQDMGQKQQELMAPIIKRAQDAIQSVSAAEDFTYVFDLATGGLVYFSPESNDILPLVKKELGIE